MSDCLPLAPSNSRLTGMPVSAALDHVVSLAREEGLGIVIDDMGEDLLAQGKKIRAGGLEDAPKPDSDGKKEEAKPKKSDIVED